MSRLLQALRSGQVLLMDGAMGTQLQRAGLAEGECCTLWNLKHPERVRAVHCAYTQVGARVLVTNTFQAYRGSLPPGWGHHQVTLSLAALALARSAGAADHFVLADLGPMPGPIWPECYGPDPFRVAAFTLSTADALLLETWSHPRALLYAKEARRATERFLSVPILLSVTYQRHPDGRLATPGGHPPERFARQARAYGVDALGVNCGRDIGMDEVIEIIRRCRAETDLPLFARPNAGTPTRVDGRWVYPRTPEDMAARLPELLEAGATMVGGCCGTTPAHIAAFRPVIDAWNRRLGGA